MVAKNGLRTLKIQTVSCRKLHMVPDLKIAFCRRLTWRFYFDFHTESDCFRIFVWLCLYTFFVFIFILEPSKALVTQGKWMQNPSKNLHKPNSLLLLSLSLSAAWSLCHFLGSPKQRRSFPPLQGKQRAWKPRMHRAHPCIWNSSTIPTEQETSGRNWDKMHSGTFQFPFFLLGPRNTAVHSKQRTTSRKARTLLFVAHASVLVCERLFLLFAKPISESALNKHNVTIIPISQQHWKKSCLGSNMKFLLSASSACKPFGEPSTISSNTCDQPFVCAPGSSLWLRVSYLRTSFKQLIDCLFRALLHCLLSKATICYKLVETKCNFPPGLLNACEDTTPTLNLCGCLHEDKCADSRNLNTPENMMMNILEAVAFSRWTETKCSSIALCATYHKNSWSHPLFLVELTLWRRKLLVMKSRKGSGVFFSTLWCCSPEWVLRVRMPSICSCGDTAAPTFL